MENWSKCFVIGLCVFSCYFLFYKQVDGTVRFLAVSIVSLHLELCKVCIKLGRNVMEFFFSSMGTLEGVHRAKEKTSWTWVIEIPQTQGVHRRSKSEPDNTSKGVVETRNSFPGRSEDWVFADLENILSQIRVKSQEGECPWALDRYGDSCGSSNWKEEHRL